MDEGTKETAHSTIDEEDISPNRNLRDQMDGTSVKSPRKSPRLMTQGNCYVHTSSKAFCIDYLVWTAYGCVCVRGGGRCLKP